MKKISLLLACFLLLTGCAIQVKTRYDKETDFSQYQTFCWMQGCEFKITGPPYLNDSLLRENIKNAIVNELSAKGFKLDDNNPDLLVGFSIAVKDEQAVLFSYAEDSPSIQQLDREPKVINYLNGTMILGMADKKKSKMVWESFAVRYMELNPDLSRENITKGIRLVLKKFPPKQ